MLFRTFDSRVVIELILLTILLILGACSSDEQEADLTPTLVPTLPPIDISQVEPATFTPTPPPTATLEDTRTPEVALSASDIEDAKVEDVEVAPRVYFRQPTDNAVAPITWTILMGFEGLAGSPAGDVEEGSGHFHSLG